VVNDNWVIKSKCFGDFVIDSEVINVLISYRQLKLHDFEAGGALVGWICKDGTMVANDLTLPQLSDERTRNSFFRSKAHNKILKDKWKASNGSDYLVGLWHTHPEAIPMYSDRDKIDWNEVLKQGEYEGKYLMFIIVGQNQIRLWITDNRTLKTSLIGEYPLDK
jgi:integrative and conjugative element protein (TIGR02256 family)